MYVHTLILGKEVIAKDYPSKLGSHLVIQCVIILNLPNNWELVNYGIHFTVKCNRVNSPHFTQTSEFESRYKSTLKIKIIKSSAIFDTLYFDKNGDPL